MSVWWFGLFGCEIGLFWWVKGVVLGGGSGVGSGLRTYEWDLERG